MYTNREYAEIAILYGECNRSARETARVYAERFPYRRHPNHTTILGLVNRFADTGSVAPRREDAGRVIQDYRFEENVLNMAHIDPTLSTREIGVRLDRHHSIVHRILQDENLYPYHYTPVQELFQEDRQRRREYCEWLLTEHERDEDFGKSIMFTDESKFDRKGIFNFRNSHYWGEENPRLVRPRSFQVRWGINIWAGLIGSTLMGPVVLPDILNGRAYVEFLDNDLRELLEDLPLQTRARMYFQQDGAPPHWSRLARNWIGQQFNRRWIGRGGPVAWPARSPDLTPLDFFLWGLMKQYVYRDPPRTLDDLLMKLHAAIALITEEMLEKIPDEIIRRATLCLENNGGHFEQF